MGKLFLNDRIRDNAALFEAKGGEFITPLDEIIKKVKKVKGFIFDWDGVFNDGIKGLEKHSGFAEADSMAVHMLRYAYWKIHGEMPVVAIITGQDNQSAFHFAEREHLTAIFAGYKNKFEPVKIFCDQYGIAGDEIASVFDDIIDYPLAVSTAVRFMVRREASPLFKKYFTENNLCDYLTYSQQPDFPVREICELIIGLWGNYDEALISRFRDPDTYSHYWDLRQSVTTRVYRNEKKL